MATNTLMAAFADYFTEDPEAFGGHPFTDLIAENASATVVARSALFLFEEQAEGLDARLSVSQDPMGLATALAEIVKAFPEEWLADLGDRLIEAFKAHTK